MNTTLSIARCGGLALIAGLALASGCRSARPVDTNLASDRDARYAAAYPIREPSRRILIDGKMDDWARDVIAVADADYVYVRFMVVNAVPTVLQHGGDTLHLMLDIDGNALTGQSRMSPTAAQGMGIDLEIQFSPPSGDGKTVRPGVAVYVLGNDGSRKRVSHAAVDFHFLPTHASEWYETRISRHALTALMPAPDVEADASAVEIVSTAPMRAFGGGIFMISDPAGEIIGGSDPFTFGLPPIASGPPVSNLVIPPRRGDVIRAMTYNVERSAHLTNPEPFVRVLSALEPDIILFQEWDGATREDITQWLTTHLGGTWYAVSMPRQGVAIASPHEIIETDTQPLEAVGQTSPVRYVGAVIRTPIRDTVAATVHLKCCGFPGSTEDHRRMAEAAAVRDRMATIMSTWPTVRLLAGDMNLVGTPDPLHIIRQGLDGDGSALAVSMPIVLGDAAMYTWNDDDNNFSPGRLDYALYGDSNTDVINAFVLDTRRLSDASLRWSGLERGDTAASDHLPIVIDLRPR